MHISQQTPRAGIAAISFQTRCEATVDIDDVRHIRTSIASRNCNDAANEITNLVAVEGASCQCAGTQY